MPEQIKRYPVQQNTATFRPNTVDLEARTVEIVFTTGEAGLRYDYWDDKNYIEELRVDNESIRPDRLNKGLSILDSHNRYGGVGSVLGVTENWRIEDGALIGTARFSKNQEAVFNDVADGILRHVSLGYRVHEWNIKAATADGEIERRTAVDWEALELSIVPVSFETANGMRQLERSGSQKLYNVKISGDTKMPDNNTRDDIQPEPVQVENINTTQTEQAPEDVRKLLPSYMEAARAAGLDSQFAVDAFAQGKTIDEFRADVIAEMGKRNSPEKIKTHAAPQGRKDEGETLVRSAGEFLAHRAGVKGAELTEGARQFSGMTLLDMARELLQRQGVTTRGLSSAGIAQRAFHSTSDFPLLLENVMNKNLLGAYQESPRTFLPLGRRTTVNDFRAKHTYRMGDAPDLLKLNEHGEYQGGTFSESGETYAIDTFARKIGFTRQMLVNDDMSALDRIPAMFGQAGARLESDLVWGMILSWDFANNVAKATKTSDGVDLFHASHNNLATTGSALSKDGLSLLRQLGRKQKTLDGKMMNATYDWLAVPSELETVAEDLLLPSLMAASIAEQPIRTKMGLIVEPRIDVLGGAAYFAFSSLLDTFEYAYLSGEQEMYTEINHHTDIDGLEVKVRKDFGCGIVDYRGMAKATGASK